MNLNELKLPNKTMSEYACCAVSSSYQQQHSWRRRRRDNSPVVFSTALLSAALLAVSSPHLTPRAVANETRHIKATAYYYPKKFYERNGLAKPENIDFTKISRVNYASFQLDERGSIWGMVCYYLYANDFA
jgi:hypothetical protein